MAEEQIPEAAATPETVNEGIGVISFDPQELLTSIVGEIVSLVKYIGTPAFAWQALAIGAAYLVAAYTNSLLRPKLQEVSSGHRYARFMAPTFIYIVWLVLQWILIGCAIQFGVEHQAMKVVASLLSAWVVIRFAAQWVRDPVWARLMAFCVWSVAALAIVGVLDETITVLDGIAVNMGEVRLSALGVIKGIISLTLLLWLAGALSKAVERRIARMTNVTPSARVLVGKLIRLLLIVIALVVAISSVGVDLTAFAVFGGALGVGIGFGLQKVISNFVSGLILLLERSIKPGDVIAVGDTYGWIQSLGARHVSLITRDGIEHLIPNEEFITQRVENWSYTSKMIRLRLPLGISYDSDLDKAMELCVEAANEADPSRIKADPEPRCLIRGFGDSAINLELRIWIDDPEQGRGNIMSLVYHLIWKKFNAHGIKIPYPQRDIHIVSGQGGLAA